MKFNDFLDKYYFKTQQENIIILLKEIGAYEEIEYAINEYYATDKKQITTQLTLMVSDCVTIINMGLERLNNNKEEKELSLAEFGIYLIKETFEFSKLNKLEYFNILKQTLKSIYKKHSWNFNRLNIILNIDNLISYTASNNETNKKRLISLKPIYLNWNSEQPLDFFINDIVEKFKINKIRKNLYKLFDRIDDDFKIILPSKYLIYFLSLFFIFNKSRMISVNNTRGLYKYLEQHIIPPKGDFFPLSEFRKIRHNAFSKDKTKKEIDIFLKPFIDRYLTKDNWTIK